MENDNVINGLLRRRQQVSDQLELVQAQMRQLVLDLDALDSTLRLFKPDVEIGVVRIKPIPRRHAAVRHESSRLVFTILRESPEPMTTRAIVRAIMEARGMNTADHAMVATMVLRLASTLRKLKNRGKLVADKQDGKNQRWRLAG
jgi:hypothetical protein